MQDERPVIRAPSSKSPLRVRSPGCRTPQIPLAWHDWQSPGLADNAARVRRPSAERPRQDSNQTRRLTRSASPVRVRGTRSFVDSHGHGLRVKPPYNNAAPPAIRPSLRAEGRRSLRAHAQHRTPHEGCACCGSGLPSESQLLSPRATPHARRSGPRVSFGREVASLQQKSSDLINRSSDRAQENPADTSKGVLEVSLEVSDGGNETPQVKVRGASLTLPNGGSLTLPGDALTGSACGSASPQKGGSVTPALTPHTLTNAALHKSEILISLMSMGLNIDKKVEGTDTPPYLEPNTPSMSSKASLLSSRIPDSMAIPTAYADILSEMWETIRAVQDHLESGALTINKSCINGETLNMMKEKSTQTSRECISPIQVHDSPSSANTVISPTGASDECNRSHGSSAGDAVWKTGPGGSVISVRHEGSTWSSVSTTVPPKSSDSSQIGSPRLPNPSSHTSPMHVHRLTSAPASYQGVQILTPPAPQGMQILTPPAPHPQHHVPPQPGHHTPWTAPPSALQVAQVHPPRSLPRADLCTNHSPRLDGRTIQQHGIRVRTTVHFDPVIIQSFA